MKIHVTSRENINTLVSSLDSSNLIVISITDPKNKDVLINHLEYKILRLKFHDMEKDYDEDGKFPGIILFNESMAKQIVNFVNLHNPSLIAIHCEVGISRSAGCAAALSRYYNDDDSMFFSGGYLPNKLVYKTLLDLLNGKDNDVPPTLISNNEGELMW